MIIDTHCHYNLDPIWSDWQQVWEKAQAHKVSSAIVVGTDLETSQRAIDIADQAAKMSAAIGIHPNSYQDLITKMADDPKKIIPALIEQIELLKKMPLKNVVAVGETGLDYFRPPSDKKQAKLIQQVQKKALKLHLQLAHELELPIILHIRDKNTPEDFIGGNAYWDAFRIVRDFRSSIDPRQLQPLILHCLSGPKNYVTEMVGLGAYIGIAGNITYKSAQPLRDLANSVPQDKLLVETDAPYLAPKSHRGEKCEPWMITETWEFLQYLTAITPEQLQANTYRAFPKLQD
jgi:TatD DNase family protein